MYGEAFEPLAELHIVVWDGLEVDEREVVVDETHSEDELCDLLGKLVKVALELCWWWTRNVCAL